MQLDNQAKADMAAFESIIADVPLATREFLRTAWMAGFLAGSQTARRQLFTPLADITKGMDQLCKAMAN